MKSKRFILTPFQANKGITHAVSMPQIDAYAVEYIDMFYNGVGGHHHWIDIKSAGIEVTSSEYNLCTNDSYELIIHYHGIRDYEALFHFVTNASLKTRMAEFYQDAEQAFDNALWLPFSLMCGGIFEGLLLAKGVSNATFANMITTARSSGDITTDEERVMNIVRSNRNLIHASRHSNSYIARKDAMDIRTTLDKMIDNF
ncbi:hypothetical protein GCM10007978_19310 [Shewanella hanedai]|uniref:DUF4145 domain-containing protein n=1 Tax=Shewanella hanedai TaxID=25 RepID=A0A553JDW0_SHEHA|nr:hypothetical protein [Shewanella hanedai]TRY10639.1 hypothetical protein FN961_25115 [Shewanella hanedai]GGI81602.1 hypothetical protein GCM10007978_19310 [Shewanella hanedai]